MSFTIEDADFGMTQDGDRNSMALVLLDGAPASIQNALSDVLKASGISDLTTENEGRLALFKDDHFVGNISYIDAPAPIADDEPSVVFAWHWPEAREILKKQKAHILVAITGSGDARAQSVLLGRILKACLRAMPGALAVHWGNSDSLWPAATAFEFLNRSDLPLPLCVSVRIVRDRKRVLGRPKISAFTKGLSFFGEREVEVSAYKGAPMALASIIWDFADYLLTSGRPVRDGDTIGFDAEQKIRVRISDALRIESAQTYKLEL